MYAIKAADNNIIVKNYTCIYMTYIRTCCDVVIETYIIYIRISVLIIIHVCSKKEVQYMVF